MTIQDLKNKDLLLFETLSGSRAYGTEMPHSDIDLRGVFILPKHDFFGLSYKEQINDTKNDEVYYEIGRFMELLSKSNPNILEMLAAPKDCIRFKHPLFEQLKPEYFLSKQCKNTFAGYAIAQVKKARGLNKKIINPMEKERKGILDFCYIVKDAGAEPFKIWLKRKGYKQKQCGLVHIPHFKETYALFYDEDKKYEFKGVEYSPIANEVALSSVPKGLEKAAILSFNKEGYQVYCKDYLAYWDWVEKRNDARYKNTLAHGKQYDAKNMMHTFRLLEMAEEIAKEGKINVRRPNREFLLKIRKGEFEYNDLVQIAEDKIKSVDILFAQSDLPDKVDLKKVNSLLVKIREHYYERE